MSEMEAISTRFECVKLGMRHTKDGHVLSLSIHPNDTPDDLFKDPLGTRYMIVAVRMNDQGEPVASPDAQEGIQAVRVAGALCTDPRFQQWLAMTNDIDEISEEAAATYVRKFCRVTSRAELKANRQARERLTGLRGEFLEYLRRGN